jgi:hypothetical protein
MTSVSWRVVRSFDGLVWLGRSHEYTPLERDFAIRIVKEIQYYIGQF